MQDHNAPYLSFSREDWRRLRDGEPLTLTEQDLSKLRGQNEPISLTEVEEIYLPLSRLLNLYVNASHELHQATSTFLGQSEPRVPYIIGLAGSVAVGKSTLARVLCTLLSRWPSHPRVTLITTDGFLYPNHVLEQRGLMNRKGFPESYDVQRLLQVLADVKAGKSGVQIPEYSHHLYDIVPDRYRELEPADIVIVEGLNVLQVGPSRVNNQPRVYVSDYFDFSIYVDAAEQDVAKWYIDRFMSFREQAYDKKEYFMHQFAGMPEVEAEKLAREIWDNINCVNLHENVAPFMYRARLILQKGQDHMVERIMLRKT